MAMGVELSHYAFWMPVEGVIAPGQSPADLLPDNVTTVWLLGLLVAVLSLVLGQVIFHRLEGKFAQEL